MRTSSDCAFVPRLDSSERDAVLNVFAQQITSFVPQSISTWGHLYRYCSSNNSTRQRAIMSYRIKTIRFHVSILHQSTQLFTLANDT